MICKNICIKVIFIKDNTAIYYQIFPLSLCCWWVHFHLLDFSRMSNTVYWSYFDCDNWILTYVCLNPYSMQICIIYSSSWYFILCTCHLGFLTCSFFAGGQRVSGPESSVFCGFPCSSAPVALRRYSSYWNRVLCDGARKGRFYCSFSPFFYYSDVCWHPVCWLHISKHWHSWQETMHILNWISCLVRGVYFGICVFLVWVQRRELLSMLLQWKSWRDYTHWTWSHWTSKDLEKDQATARDR